MILLLWGFFLISSYLFGIMTARSVKQKIGEISFLSIQLPYWYFAFVKANYKFLILSHFSTYKYADILLQMLLTTLLLKTLYKSGCVGSFRWWFFLSLPNYEPDRSTFSPIWLNILYNITFF